MHTYTVIRGGLFLFFLFLPASVVGLFLSVAKTVKTERMAKHEYAIFEMKFYFPLLLCFVSLIYAFHTRLYFSCHACLFSSSIVRRTTLSPIPLITLHFPPHLLQPSLESKDGKNGRLVPRDVHESGKSKT